MYCAVHGLLARKQDLLSKTLLLAIAMSRCGADIMADRIEKTASNSSIVAYVSVAAVT
jgi:hypothetical protein